MELLTRRLLVRRMDRKDFSAIHEMNSFPEVARYNTVGIPEDLRVTETMLEKVLQADNNYYWVVYTLGEESFVGLVGMNTAAQRFRKAEIHYSLHPDQWGMGYGTEAVCAVIDWGFGELNLHRIEAGVAVDNLKSIALLERVGMIREGLCRKILPLQTGWADNYMYAILDEDKRGY